MNNFIPIPYIEVIEKSGFWEYSDYTIWYGIDSVEKIARKISDIVDIKEYAMLQSVKEFKRACRRYGN